MKKLKSTLFIICLFFLLTGCTDERTKNIKNFVEGANSNSEQINVSYDKKTDTIKYVFKNNDGEHVDFNYKFKQIALNNVSKVNTLIDNQITHNYYFEDSIDSPFLSIKDNQVLVDNIPLDKSQEIINIMSSNDSTKDKFNYLLNLGLTKIEARTEFVRRGLNNSEDYLYAAYPDDEDLDVLYVDLLIKNKDPDMPMLKLVEMKKITTEQFTEYMKIRTDTNEKPYIVFKQVMGIEDSENIKSSQTIDTNQTNISSFKQKAEANTKKYPATTGSVLVTKGDYNFTGKPYYFKGSLLEVGTSEIFNNKTVWIIKNDNGYVMPIEMLDGETSNIGDTVEVWGTLSGDGYKLPNVENVVGETGYIIMMQYSVNGEDII